MNKIWVIAVITGVIIFAPGHTYAATGCVENGLNRYYDTIKKPFEDIEVPDTSGLSACASAITALSSLSTSVSLATINLGAILSAIINAFISGFCQYVNGKISNVTGNIQAVVAQANRDMQQFINEREQRIDQINRGNIDTYIDFQIQVNTGIDNTPQ